MSRLAGCDILTAMRRTGQVTVAPVFVADSKVVKLFRFDALPLPYKSKATSFACQLKNRENAPFWAASRRNQITGFAICISNYSGR